MKEDAPTELQSGGQATGEILFGLVGAVGTDLRNISNVLKESLLTRRFDSIEVHLSDLLGAVKGWKYVPTDLDDLRKRISQLPQIPEDERVTLLMDLGNVVRKMFNRGDAVALLAIGAIREERSERNRGGNKERPNAPLPRTAFILRSLKNPAEVSILRRVYGRRFFLIAAYSPREKRVQQLAQKIAASHDNPRWLELKGTAEKLADRDESEAGENLGQNVRDTFALADVFIDATSPNGDSLKAQIQRFIELVFANLLHTPTREEYGMFHAFAAASRSGALSRQVGASLVTEDGNIISLGANEVPKAGGGFYWPGDEEDARDLRKGYDQSDKMERAILKEIFQHLEKRNWLARPSEYTIDQLATFSTKGFQEQLSKARNHFNEAVRGDDQAAREFLALVAKTPIDVKLRERITKVFQEIIEKKARADSYLVSLLETAFSAPMRGARVTELTEYSRTVHAEMAALLEAARHGGVVKDSTLYSTTFPCHVCTRHIVAAGIRQVVYIEPYPKSYAEEQHGDAISVDKTSPEPKVSFVPFVGISPRQYLPFFSVDFFDRKRKDEHGNVIRPTSEDLPVFREPSSSYINRETDVWDQTVNLLTTNWLDGETAEHA